MQEEESTILGLIDYIRIIKPRIIPLLLLVALTSSIIASKSIPHINTLIALSLGGSLTSAGSLAMNSYLEMGIDSRMRRTMKRPLPSGKVRPKNAFILSIALLSSGILLSALTLSPISAFFIALGALVYLPIYTIILKPRTSLNIVLGGFAGSCAALAGWYAVTDSNAIYAWLLAALVFIWTPSHFWSLAVVTEEDYSAVGIPMLPSILGPKLASRYIVANTLILIPISFLLIPFFDGHGLMIYLSTSIIVNSLLLFTNLRMFISPSKENAWIAFKFSSPYLAIIFIAAMIAALY